LGKGLEETIQVLLSLGRGGFRRRGNKDSWERNCSEAKKRQLGGISSIIDNQLS
jgi:hypothetical protein